MPSTAALLTLCLASLQAAALAVLAWRLLPGRTRQRTLPVRSSGSGGTVTVIVATLNEAERIGPCLDGLMAQPATMIEALVVDSNSQDGTRDLVEAAAQRDDRIRLVDDGPLPDGWIGKVWALQQGLEHARGEWILGIDADTRPKPWLVESVLDAVRSGRYDVASFAPRFVGQTAAERWLQPAMLVTLVYRTGAAGARNTKPDRVLANGQCFAARREILVREGGYAIARESFADDVTLARHLAHRGARVGFLDGSALIDVHAYTSMPQMWREWGRSFDLKDATRSWRRLADLLVVWLVQPLPPVLLAISLIALRYAGDALSRTAWMSIALTSGVAFAIRLLMLVALRHNYDRRGMPYWWSFTADIPAAVRLTLSTLRRPRQWRGRQY